MKCSGFFFSPGVCLSFLSLQFSILKLEAATTTATPSLHVVVALASDDSISLLAAFLLPSSASRSFNPRVNPPFLSSQEFVNRESPSRSRRDCFITKPSKKTLPQPMYLLLLPPHFNRVFGFQTDFYTEKGTKNRPRCRGVLIPTPPPPPFFDVGKK